MDPLDTFLLSGEGTLILQVESEPAPPPDLVITLLDPLRPDHDLLFLDALREKGTPIRNRPQALSLFRDPLLPHSALAGAGLPVIPAVRLRRPHAVEAALETVPLPVEARLPIAHGRWERSRFEDQGSLRAVVDLLWREDLPVLIAPAAETWTAESWIPVVGGETVGDEAPLASEAAQVLGLDLCAVRLRGKGEDALIAEVAPFPAPPGTDLSPEVGEAIVAKCLEG
jgi:hypothetical protein